MAWVRVDDGAMDHPKVCGLSDKAFRLWIWGLCHCQRYLTDGAIVSSSIPQRFKRASPDLLQCGLWEPWPNGYMVHDYLDWNDSRAIVEERRAGAQKRVQGWREKRGKNVAFDGDEKRVGNALQNALQKRVSDPTSETPLARLGVVKDLSFQEREFERKPTAEVSPDDALLERAGHLRQVLYPAWYAKHRHGAKLRIVANSLEFEDALSLVRTWDDERLAKLAQIVLLTDDEFISKTDRGFKIFALKASWADDRLKQVERNSGVTT